jgi:hypothetical protein
MPIDEDHAVIDKLVGIGDGLFRIARIIQHDVRDRFSQHTALGVDVGHRLVGAGAQLRPEGGVRAGERADHADLGLRESWCGGGRGGKAEGEDASGDFFQIRSPFQVAGSICEIGLTAKRPGVISAALEDDDPAMGTGTA